jgi:hypothetical protein
LALCPDVTLDGVRDVLVGMIDLHRGREVAWVFDGRTGVHVLAIQGRVPFDPWAADDHFQNAVAEGKDNGLANRIGQALGWGVQPYARTRWRAITDGLDFANVVVVGSSGRRLLGSDPQVPVTLGGVSVQLRSVSFIGDATILRDQYPQTAYPSLWLDANGDSDANDWTDGDRRSPILYEAGDDVRVGYTSISISEAYAFNLSQCEVRGAVGSSVVFTSTALAYDGTGTRISVTGILTGSYPSTAGEIAYWPNWSITWSLRENAMTGPVSYPAGTSSNHLHFSLDIPGGVSMYYSFIHYGCKLADGLDGSDQGAVADRVWAGFAEWSVVRAQDLLEGALSPPTLKYYADWMTENVWAGDLLEEGDGQCNAWVHFFISCLHAVGVNPDDERVRLVNGQDNPHPTHNDAKAVFLVKSWNPGSQTNPLGFLNLTTEGDYVYLNIWDNPELNNNQYQWLYADVTDSSGVSGQGTSNPLSYFNQHFIVRVDGQFYDPSYGGSVHASIDAWEAASIWGLGLQLAIPIPESEIGTDLDGDGNLDDAPDVPAVLIEANPTGTQIEASYTDW